ncbi:MAG: hypothetical protein SGPRY_005718, partial [Prymnesium sp.]
YLRHFASPECLEPLVTIDVQRVEVANVKKPRRFKHAFRLNILNESQRHTKYTVAAETAKDSLAWTEALLDAGACGLLRSQTTKQGKSFGIGGQGKSLGTSAQGKSFGTGARRTLTRAFGSFSRKKNTIKEDTQMPDEQEEQAPACPTPAVEPSAHSFEEPVVSTPRGPARLPSFLSCKTSLEMLVDSGEVDGNSPFRAVSKRMLDKAFSNLDDVSYAPRIYTSPGDVDEGSDDGHSEFEFQTARMGTAPVAATFSPISPHCLESADSVLSSRDTPVLRTHVQTASGDSVRIEMCEAERQECEAALARRWSRDRTAVPLQASTHTHAPMLFPHLQVCLLTSRAQFTLPKCEYPHPLCSHARRLMQDSLRDSYESLLASYRDERDLPPEVVRERMPSFEYSLNELPEPVGTGEVTACAEMEALLMVDQAIISAAEAAEEEAMIAEASKFRLQFLKGMQRSFVGDEVDLDASEASDAEIEDARLPEKEEDADTSKGESNDEEKVVQGQEEAHPHEYAEEAPVQTDVETVQPTPSSFSTGESNESSSDPLKQPEVVTEPAKKNEEEALAALVLTPEEAKLPHLVEPAVGSTNIAEIESSSQSEQDGDEHAAFKWLRAVLMQAGDIETLNLLKSEASMLESLKSGEVLCKMLNAIRSDAVRQPKAGGRFVHLENLSAYASATRAIGLAPQDCLDPAAWLDGASFELLLPHLVALCRSLPSAPPLQLKSYVAAEIGGKSRVRTTLSAKEAAHKTNPELQEQQRRSMEQINTRGAKAFFSKSEKPSAARGTGMRAPRRVVGNTEVTHSSASTTIRSVKSAMGATHSFAESETRAFTLHVNQSLAQDEDCAHLLPIAEDTFDLFEALKDGVLLCKLINNAVADTVDIRCVHTGKDRPLSVYEVTENLNLAINAAVALGCRVVNIGAGDILSGSPHLVLGLLWQIVKACIMASLNLKASPKLIQLLSEEQGADAQAVRELLGLPPEKVLLRWVNHQLRRAGLDVEVKNFGKDFKDSTVYAALLAAVAPAEHRSMLSRLASDVKREVAPEVRAQMVLDAAENLGITQFRIQPGDIVRGNEKLNMGFLAAIFNALPGLDGDDDEASKVLAEHQLEDDIDASREERAFRMWINSLGLDRHVNDTISEMRDGLLMLQIMDTVRPGVVDWSCVVMHPKNVYSKVANCNYAVKLGITKFNFSLVGIAGADICEGNVKLILAITWQLMRYHVITFLSRLSKSGAMLTEADVIAWANSKVSHTSCGTISSLKEPSLSSGLFFLELLHAIEPRCVDRELFTRGSSSQEKELNAKLAISCARRLGCMVFLLHEDIVEVKPKMLLVFAATLMSYAANKGK